MHNETKIELYCSQITPQKNDGDSNNKPINQARIVKLKHLIKQSTKNIEKRERDYMSIKKIKESMAVIAFLSSPSMALLCKKTLSLLPFPVIFSSSFFWFIPSYPPKSLCNPKKKTFPPLPFIL